MSNTAAGRGGEKHFFTWRAKKKEMMLHVARGNKEQAWQELREMMLLVNRNFDEVQTPN